jgi:hypothetical protein
MADGRGKLGSILSGGVPGQVREGDPTGGMPTILKVIDLCHFDL